MGTVGAVTEMPSLEAEAIQIQAPRVELVADPDDPNAMTLKQVHDWLVERIDHALPIDVNDASVSRNRRLER